MINDEYLLIPFQETYACKGCGAWIGVQAPFQPFPFAGLYMQLNTALAWVIQCPHCGDREELFVSLNKN